MITKKTYFLLIIVYLLSLYSVQAQIGQSDKLIEDLQISDVKTSFINGQGFFFTQIIDFPNEKFAHILIKGDEKVYAFITQNGQAMGSLIGPLNEIQNYNVLTVNACRFGDEKLIVTYSQKITGQYVKQYLQVVDINTQQKVGSNVVFSQPPPNSDHWMGKCNQIDENYIGLGWAVYRYGFYYRNYNVNTGALSTTQRLNDPTAHLEQFTGFITVLKNSTRVVTAWGQFVSSTKMKTYFSIVERDGAAVQTRIEVENSYLDKGSYFTPIVASTDAGGFVIVFYNSKNGDTFMGHYNADGTKICNQKIGTLKRWPNVIAYKDKAYITYSDWESTNSYLVGKTAYIAKGNLTSCEIEDEQKIMDNEIFYHVYLAMATGEQATILGVQYIAMEEGSRKLKYTEYFIDAPYLNNNSGSGSGGNSGGSEGSEGSGSSEGDGGTAIPETLCTNKDCFGCYGQNLDTCPMCAGSTSELRAERKTISSGTCECPIATHFENSTKDCQLCSSLGVQYRDQDGVCRACQSQCASCSNGDTCDTCVDSNLRKEDNCQECPEIFYLNQNQQCKECIAECASCSDGLSCDSCKNSNNIKELQCQSCPSIYYVDNEGICQGCISTCKTCSNDTSCDSCPETHLNINQNCTCPEIYYLDSNGICQECNSACLSCFNSTSCSLCKQENMLPGTLCTVSSIGSFETVVDGQNVVLQCASQCESCSNATECITCKDSSKNPQFNCSCPEISYTDSDGVCQECQSSCNSCTDSNGCEECKQNFVKENDICVCSLKDFILHEGECLNKCPEKQFMDLSELACKDCLYYQDLCIAECPKDTTQNSSTKVCEKAKSLDLMLVSIVLGVGLILILLGLLYNCKTVKYSQIFGTDKQGQQQKSDPNNEGSIILHSQKDDKQEDQQKVVNISISQIDGKSQVDSKNLLGEQSQIATSNNMLQNVETKQIEKTQEIQIQSITEVNDDVLGLNNNNENNNLESVNGIQDNQENQVQEQENDVQPKEKKTRKKASKRRKTKKATLAAAVVDEQQNQD